MGGKVILLLADRDDPKRGEIAVLEEVGEAEQTLEALLAAGFERERIRVFLGVEVEVEVSYRPVVSLGREKGAQGWNGSSGESRPGEVEPSPDGGVPHGDFSEAPSKGMPRFSSLFRPAYK